MATHSCMIQRAAVRSGSPALPQPRGWSPLPAQTAGRPLPEPVRVKMERSLGHDFSDVRVHHGSEAEAIGARAFARGSALFFGHGRYSPWTSRGQHLLGHELVHVVQQRIGKAVLPQGKGTSINSDRALESEADRLGKGAARGEAAEIRGSSDSRGQGALPPIQCNGHDEHEETPYLPYSKIAGMISERLLGVPYGIMRLHKPLGLTHKQGHSVHAAGETGGLPMQTFLTGKSFMHSSQPGDRFKQASGVFGTAAGLASAAHLLGSIKRNKNLLNIGRAAPPLARASLATLVLGGAWAAHKGRKIFGRG